MFLEKDRLLFPPSQHQNKKGGDSAFPVFEVSRFFFYRRFGDFSVDVSWNIRPLKNNGRGVNFQCRKGVSFRVASNNHTKTIKAALLLWCF